MDNVLLSEQPAPLRPWSGFFRGAVAMLPLCLSVIPWGILAGSMAVQAGLTFAQSLGMSAIIFAGAAQLVTLGLLLSGGSVLTIVVSVFFITSQHLLYGLTLRETVARMALRYRLPVGYLLCDELFALASAQPKEKLTPGYLIGAGLCFYLCWVLFSLAGVVMASAIPDLDRWHLDFSIVATFITIVVPMVQSRSVLCGVVVSLLLSMILSLYRVEGAIVIAGLSGMLAAVAVARLTQGAK